MSGFTGFDLDVASNLDDLIPNQPVHESEEKQQEPPPLPSGGMNVEGPTG